MDAIRSKYGREAVKMAVLAPKIEAEENPEDLPF